MTSSPALHRTPTGALVVWGATVGAGAALVLPILVAIGIAIRGTALGTEPEGGLWFVVVIAIEALVAAVAYAVLGTLTGLLAAAAHALGLRRGIRAAVAAATAVSGVVIAATTAVLVTLVFGLGPLEAAGAGILAGGIAAGATCAVCLRRRTRERRTSAAAWPLAERAPL
ncbi:hypothetical protein [Clavibacter zhangzhiyongii]|uniref:Uncharacterized protein n=1 Tax=Clavibacter zhangzhiyongii TaxID=2768071 RepID=A0A7L7Z304_9MICO|nr:hypothetical protein [Clavibacter zhangzhiyongii]QOD44113.1 hypothetical protein H9X71_01760 [Clavibacter zhangzhiyongii]